MTLHHSGNSPMRKVSSGTGVSPVFSGHYVRPRCLPPARRRCHLPPGIVQVHLVHSTEFRDVPAGGLARETTNGLKPRLTAGEPGFKRKSSLPGSTNVG